MHSTSKEPHLSPHTTVVSSSPSSILDTIPKLDIDRIHSAMTGVDLLGGDFAIFKDLPGTEFAAQPIRLTPTVFSLVLSGTASMRINMQEFTFRPNQLVTFFSQHIIEGLHTSSDFSALFIAISPDFIRDSIPQQEMLLPMMLHVTSSPALSLTMEEVERMKSFYNMLITTTRLKHHPYHKHILKSLIATVFYDVAGIFRLRHVNNDIPSNLSRKQDIFSTFLHLVSQHCRRERSVQFYAQQMCYTPKYLSTIIKELTDRTALEWIEEFTIIEAKTLLRSTSKSIQEIAYTLGFPTQSFFGKYFKHNTGISPGRYRNEQTGLSVSDSDNVE